jgi:hypothetical protein
MVVKVFIVYITFKTFYISAEHTLGFEAKLSQEIKTVSKWSSPSFKGNTYCIFI